MPDKKLTPAEVAENIAVVGNIPAWLRHRGLTQADLAENLKRSTGTVSKYLSGRQTMSAAQFFAIAALLETTPEDLALPPGQGARAARYKKLAEAMKAMPDDRFAAFVDGLLAMSSRP